MTCIGGETFRDIKSVNTGTIEELKHQLRGDKSRRRMKKKKGIVGLIKVMRGGFKSLLKMKRTGTGGSER